MSLNLVRKNSSSPFHLQRSIVDQGGEGGAYERGGYDPSNVYSDGGIASAIAGIGTVAAAAIEARTPGDDNQEDLKKQKRLENKVKDLKEKRSGNTSMEDITGKNAKIDKRLERINKRQENIGNRIKEYNEIQKPTVKSDIAKPEPSKKPVKIEKKMDTTSSDWRKTLLNWNF